MHTGDWKIDPDPLIGGQIDKDKLISIGNTGISAMICDSTNVFSPGRAGSESDVRESLLKIMLTKTNRILVTSFASNVARMESIFYCAKKTGRNICLVGRSMQRIYKAAKKCGYLKGPIDPIEPKDAKKLAKNKILFLATGSQGEPMGAMNRIINGVHPDVFLEQNDCVIFSSKIIPGNEKKLYHLQNMIVKNKMEMISEENAFVHVSGHPNRDDLKDMYNWVKPHCLIPVHGEHRHMAEHVAFAKEMQIPKTLLIENGDIIKILPGDKPKIIDKAPSGKVYLDGNVNVEIDSKTIKDRKNLSANGYLEITLIITDKGKLKKPIISFKGIPEQNEDHNFVFDVEDEIFNICRTFSIDNKKQQQNLIETIKKNCRRIIREKTVKKPFTNINIARI